MSTIPVILAAEKMILLDDEPRTAGGPDRGPGPLGWALILVILLIAVALAYGIFEGRI